jgi:outer membrane protein assembly factor BamB
MTPFLLPPMTALRALRAAALVLGVSLWSCGGPGPATGPTHHSPSPPTPVAAELGALRPSAPCPAASRRDPLTLRCQALDCAATETHSWRRRFSLDGLSTTADRLAIGPDGSIIMVGGFSGELTLRTRPPAKPSDVIHSNGQADVYVTKLDPAGHFLWRKHFGDREAQYGSGVAVDRAGNIIVTGEFHGTMSFGGPTLESIGESDFFIAKLDATGKHLWSKSFGNPRTQYHARVATLSNGRIVLTGFFYGLVDVGGGPIDSDDGNSFIALYEPDGRHLWSYGVGKKGPMIASLAIDGQDNIVVFGDIARPLQLPPGPVLRPVGLRDLFLAKLDPQGRALWSKHFGKMPMTSHYPQGLAIDGDGAIAISGRYEGAIGFGGIPLKIGPKRSQLFVAKLGPDGSHQWSKAVGVGDPHSNARLLVAFGAQRRVYLGGSFMKDVDFGGGLLSPFTGGDDPRRRDMTTAPSSAFVATLGPRGEHLSSTLYGDTGDDVHSVTTDGCGHALVAGFNDWHNPNTLFLGRLP